MPAIFRAPNTRVCIPFPHIVTLANFSFSILNHSNRKVWQSLFICSKNGISPFTNTKKAAIEIIVIVQSILSKSNIVPII